MVATCGTKLANILIGASRELASAAAHAHRRNAGAILDKSNIAGASATRIRRIAIAAKLECQAMILITRNYSTHDTVFRTDGHTFGSQHVTQQQLYSKPIESQREREIFVCQSIVLVGRKLKVNQVYTVGEVWQTNCMHETCQLSYKAR